MEPIDRDQLKATVVKLRKEVAQLESIVAQGAVRETQRLAAVTKERDELVKGNMAIVRDRIASEIEQGAALFKDKTNAELRDALLTATVGVPTAYQPLFAAIGKRLDRLALLESAASALPPSCQCD
jgi:hypothetical protein